VRPLSACAQPTSARGRPLQHPPHTPILDATHLCSGSAVAVWGTTQALVAREACPALGVSHVDTALVAHNLGCVLDQLGKTQKALELVGGALKVGGQESLRAWPAWQDAEGARAGGGGKEACVLGQRGGAHKQCVGPGGHAH